jgi:hypothetical protein
MFIPSHLHLLLLLGRRDLLHNSITRSRMGLAEALDIIDVESFFTSDFRLDYLFAGLIPSLISQRLLALLRRSFLLGSLLIRSDA